LPLDPLRKPLPSIIKLQAMVRNGLAVVDRALGKESSRNQEFK
jgi:hypothetical protein